MKEVYESDLVKFEDLSFHENVKRESECYLEQVLQQKLDDLTSVHVISQHTSE